MDLWVAQHPSRPCRMPKAPNRVLARIAEIAPPFVRERVIPALENHILPLLSHVPRPLIRGLALYVLLQVMLAESTTVRKAWWSVRGSTPRAVHSAVVAAGGTFVGRTVWGATLAIRSTSNALFQPIRALHAHQEERGAAAGEGLVRVQEAIDAIGAPPPNTPTTLDDVMKELERTPSTPRR